MSGNREILMKFITGQNEKVRQDISMQGYKDTSPYRNNPSNTIYGTSQGTPITMQGVSTPLVGMDEFGNRQEMYPGQTYEFPGTRVVETPIAKSGGQMIKRADGSYSQRGLWDNIRAAKGSGKKPTKEMLQQEKKIKSEYKNGGSLLTKTMTCSNCGWSWKAADGGNDVTTCHKCGGEALLNAQAGGDTYKFGPIPITHGDFYNVNLTKSQYQEGGENQDIVNWTKQYVNSPKYKERITNAGYDNPDKQINKRLQNLENVNIVETSNPQGTVYKPFRNTIETSYPADLEYYDIHKNLYPTKPKLDSIIAHELGHSETNRKDSNTSLLNKRDREELKNRLVPEAYDDLEVFINGYIKHDKSHHNIIPEENKADLNSFRYDLRKIYDAGNQDFTEETLKNSPESFAKERLLKNYSADDLIWLMNNVAQNDTTPKMPTALHGGTWFGNADEMSVSNKYDIGGTTVAEQYTQITGKPWSTARAEGLTDGTAKQNLALIERLKNPQPVVVEQNTPQPVAIEEPVYSNEELHRKELAKRVVQLAEERIKNNNYIDVPSDVKEASYLRGEVPFGCIGGACTVLKDAGVMKNVDWSNTHFAENAKEYGFTANNGWGVKGIKNLEPGDLLMYNQHKNAQGNYYPSHSQIYLGKTDTGRYRFFDNFRKEVREYDQSDIEEKVDPSRKKTEMSATIYKVNPFIDDNMLGLSEQALKNLADKKEFIEKESTSKSSYKWKIASDSKDYNNTTKRVMDNFIAFANDNDKINDLVKKTGKSKAEIQDSLLNVFGELGVENNWTTSKGKGLGSRLENIAESLLTAVGGGKGLSVGPGQIKYSELQKEADAAKKAGTPSLKEQFNITSPNDLYDLNKVLPLMTAMDLRDKQVLEKWSENNTLSQKLFGWTRPEIENGGGQGVTTGGFKVDQLSTETDNSILNNGVGRYSPYLRNQYSSINSGTSYQGNNDWIPFNEGTVPNFSPAMYNTSGQDEMKIKYQRDPGSYPYKVESNWRNNLNRLITPNEDGTIELNEVVVKSKKKR